jgi:hypothetical protein
MNLVTEKLLLLTLKDYWVKELCKLESECPHSEEYYCAKDMIVDIEVALERVQGALR